MRTPTRHPLLLLLLATLSRASGAELEGGGRSRPSWQARLSTYSIASVARRAGRRDWNEVTQGNKIVLPAEVLDYLTSRGLPYDKFQLLNPAKRDLRLFTGPLDFCAASGECYLPSWVMRQLGLKEGEPCAVATACFPSAAFIKFQPHSSTWLDVCENTYALTEAMQNLGGLTQGSYVRVCMGGKTFNLDVVEVKGKPLPPSQRDDSKGMGVAIGLQECPFEFAEPKDLVKKRKGKKAKAKAADGAAASAEGGDAAAAEEAAGAAAPADGAQSAADADADADAQAAPPKPVPKFKRRKAAEEGGSGVAAPDTPYVGKARSLGGESADDEGAEGSGKELTGLAKARAEAKAAKAAEEAEAKAAEEAAEAAALAARPPLQVAFESLLELVRSLLLMLLRIVRGIITPSDVRFDS